MNAHRYARTSRGGQITFLSPYTPQQFYLEGKDSDAIFTFFPSMGKVQVLAFCDGFLVRDEMTLAKARSAWRKCIKLGLHRVSYARVSPQALSARIDTALSKTF
jgi:hypothetical protein